MEACHKGLSDPESSEKIYETHRNISLLGAAQLTIENLYLILQTPAHESGGFALSELGLGSIIFRRRLRLRLARLCLF